jgi:single-stranded DNA-specific DHH superfamily exonuclease
MLYTTRTIAGITISYSEVSEFQTNIPDNWNKENYKLWLSENNKEIKEMKAEMKAEMEKLIIEKDNESEDTTNKA